MRGRSQAKQHVRASLRAVFDRRNRAPPEPFLGRLSEVLSAPEQSTYHLPSIRRLRRDQNVLFFVIAFHDTS